MTYNDKGYPTAGCLSMIRAWVIAFKFKDFNCKANIPA